MIVIAERRGGLGNRLILFSHVLAYARDRGSEARYPAFRDYRRCFIGELNGSRGRVATPTLPRLSRYLDAPLAGLTRTGASLRTDWGKVAFVRAGWNEIIDLSGEDHVPSLFSKPLVLLHGWGLRAYASFLEHRDWLRAYFRLTPALANRVADRLSASLSKNALNIGVHIRQGDYRDHLGGRFFYSLSAYGRLIDQLAELLAPRKVRFVVFSDELLDRDSLPSVDLIMSRAEPVVDMYSLAKCDLIVGPPSSFSWWSSFIGSTPLYMVGSMEEDLSLDLFQVAPSAHSKELAALYW